MENIKLKFLAVLTVLGAGLLFVTSVLSYHGLPTPKAPEGCTVFKATNGDFRLTREYVLTGMPNHQHHKFAFSRVNKAELIFHPVNGKPGSIREMIIDTQDGLRIAVENKAKLATLLKNNPQWLADNHISFYGTKDTYYYAEVTTLDQVWLGERDGKVVLVAIKTKP